MVCREANIVVLFHKVRVYSQCMKFCWLCRISTSSCRSRDYKSVMDDVTIIGRIMAGVAAVDEAVVLVVLVFSSWRSSRIVCTCFGS